MLYLLKKIKFRKFSRKSGDQKTDRYALASAILLSALMTACGGSASRSTQTTSASPSSTGSTSATPAPTPSYGTTVQSQTAGSDTNFLPSISLDFSTYGLDTFQSQPILTDNQLKVRVSALPAGKAMGSNNTANYNCIVYEVSLKNSNGVTLKTETVALSVDGKGNQLCPSAPKEKIVDFSAYMTAGHSAMTVTAKGTLYDYYAQFGYYWLFAIYDQVVNGQRAAHNVKGNLSVQVNGSGS